MSDYLNWRQANRRRGDLIDRQIAGNLTELESLELAALQAFADFHQASVAPHPIAELEKLEKIVAAANS